ncbi:MULTISPECIES: YbaN family protein [unclassified Acidovorax]|uniref:YbaN family protein n=1 Tax=unclassified Acidovorax TaxID=2684926 RepID=UPI002883484F|nr:MULTISPECIES: YbaN family protein [unclassified Acidovorax]
MTNPNTSLKPSWQRPLYFGVGCLSLAFGVVALVVPLIPGIVFLALAAGCFSRSSPAMDRWLTTHPRFGKLITNWQTSGAISRTTKWVITASMVASFSLIFFETPSRAIQAAVAAGMLAVLVYVWKRPEQANLPAAA